MHQCTDITNYPEHFSLFPNSLIMLISALKCLISVWGEMSKIACRFLDYWYLALSKQNRILLQVIFNGKFFSMSVNLNNWLGDSTWGCNTLKGYLYLESMWRTPEDWLLIPGHLLDQLLNFRNLILSHPPLESGIGKEQMTLTNTSSGSLEGTTRWSLLWSFQGEWILPVYDDQFPILENLERTMPNVV